MLTWLAVSAAARLGGRPATSWRSAGLEFAFGGRQICCGIVGSMGPAEGPGAGTLAAAGDEARLLVVEDEPTILELLSGSLRFAGFDVVTASSGSGALRAAAACLLDPILLDVMLPDGDGFEVVRTLRSSGPRVPVNLHHRAGGRARPGDRADDRRGRLRHQAVQPG